MSHRLLFAAVALFLVGSVLSAQDPGTQQPPPRTTIILDAALGSDLGDAFALGLILASPEFEPLGVTTVGKDGNVRGLMACRFLTMSGRRSVPASVGADPQPNLEIAAKGQYRYYYHPDVLFNRTMKPAAEPAVDFLYGRFKGRPGKVTLVATGPLTNVARLLKEKPDVAPLIGRVIVSWTEENLAADVAAARAIMAAEIPVVFFAPEVADSFRLSEADLKRVFAPATQLSMQMQALYQLTDQKDLAAADLFAVALALKEDFATTEPRKVEVADDGKLTITVADDSKIRVVTSVKADAFREWYLTRMSDCVSPTARPVKPIAAGKMPHRVHVAEDFDNDIERFWWMAGKEETVDVPPGSKRACRGTLTHNYDDLLGNPKSMETAVIFNPVPGPPMGKNPRLSFRYKLTGADSIRVQIYSLTNGYHRCLQLTGVVQDRWESAAVDMTLARRPDGTGGPLSEGERIDDIQFYVPPTADILIDDIVLYDAAPAGQESPFPKRIMFTGWFDSGKQGKEWPGDFEIVDNAGFFWKGAKATAGKPLKVHLRGVREMASKTELFVRHRASAAGEVKVTLISGENAGGTGSIRVGEAWNGTTLRFPETRGRFRADALLFETTVADFTIDDLLLYEP